MPKFAFPATETPGIYQIQLIPVNWARNLFRANSQEHKQIENIARVCFVYLGHELSQ
jgi:hypothetical protein